MTQLLPSSFNKLFTFLAVFLSLLTFWKIYLDKPTFEKSQAQFSALPLPSLSVTTSALSEAPSVAAAPSLETSPHSSSSIINKNNQSKVKNNNEEEFPPGCNWKCYLRNNPDILKEIPFEEQSATQHYQKHGMDEKKRCHCEIILLAGPHKAASSTLQHIASVYSSMSNVPWNWLNHHHAHNSEMKAFAPFVWSLLYNETRGIDRYYEQYNQKNMKKGLVLGTSNNETSKMLFQNEMMKQFNEGYNIIFGNEEIDRLTRPIYKNTDLINEIMDILPNKDITIQNNLISVVVVYRSPRIDHFKSLWKQVKRVGNLTFYEFLHQETDNLFLERQFPSIDSLELAAAFLKKGLKVKLLDMSGIPKDEGIDFYDILGCDMMKLDCHYQQHNEKSKRMPVAISKTDDSASLLEKFTKSKNVRDSEEYILNVTEVEMVDIDILLRRYDCNHRDIFQDNDDKLKVLYGKDIHSNLNECHTIFADAKLLTRVELLESIKQVFKSK